MPHGIVISFKKMSLANSLFTILLLVLLLTKCVLCQTYSNCKNIGSGVKVEWTTDTNNNRLTARFTVPNSFGYAAVGFKSGSTSGMAGSTILVASKDTIVGEYYAANFMPSAIQGAPYYTSASSTFSANVTTINLVRSLTRPGTAPNTYYEISNGNSMKLLVGAHSSSAYPLKHDSTVAVVLDLFSSSSCAQASSAAPQNSTTGGNKTNDASTLVGRELLILVSMIFALFLTLATF